jgi:hypothetical protein
MDKWGYERGRCVQPLRSTSCIAMITMEWDESVRLAMRVRCTGGDQREMFGEAATINFEERRRKSERKSNFPSRELERGDGTDVSVAQSLPASSSSSSSSTSFANLT